MFKATQVISSLHKGAFAVFIAVALASSAQSAILSGSSTYAMTGALGQGGATAVELPNFRLIPGLLPGNIKSYVVNFGGTVLTQNFAVSGVTPGNFPSSKLEIAFNLSENFNFPLVRNGTEIIGATCNAAPCNYGPPSTFSSTIPDTYKVTTRGPGGTLPITVSTETRNIGGTWSVQGVTSYQVDYYKPDPSFRLKYEMLQEKIRNRSPEVIDTPPKLEFQDRNSPGSGVRGDIDDGARFGKIAFLDGPPRSPSLAEGSMPDALSRSAASSDASLNANSLSHLFTVPADLVYGFMVGTTINEFNSGSLAVEFANRMLGFVDFGIMDIGTDFLIPLDFTDLANRSSIFKIDGSNLAEGAKVGLIYEIYAYSTFEEYRLALAELSVSAVPEPATVTMLFGGLLLLGLTARRRER